MLCQSDRKLIWAFFGARRDQLGSKVGRENVMDRDRIGESNVFMAFGSMIY